MAIDVTTAQAARILGVSPGTLRDWHETFGYPPSQGQQCRARIWPSADILALRDALGRYASVSAAIEAASAATATHAPPRRFAG